MESQDFVGSVYLPNVGCSRVEDVLFAGCAKRMITQLNESDRIFEILTRSGEESIGFLNGVILRFVFFYD